MDGYKLIETLRLTSPRTVCVVVSGLLDPIYPLGLPQNVYTCIQKPCEFEAVQRALHAAVTEYVMRAMAANTRIPEITNPCF